MSERYKEVLLTPQTETKRLWEGARAAFERSGESVVALSETVDLSVRVVELLMIQCLQSVRDDLWKTVTCLLEVPPPDVAPERDLLKPPRALRFVDALDILSADDLPCVSQSLHHGWMDHVALCRETRKIAKKVTRISLGSREHDALMLIGAYRNRIFLLPPPVRVVPDAIAEAFPIVAEVVDDLFAAAKIDR